MRTLPVALAALLVASTLLALPQVDAQGGSSRAPIVIQSNLDFTPVNGVIGGVGTAANPFIIQNWDIRPTSASQPNAILIRDTTSYVTIRQNDLSLGYADQANQASFTILIDRAQNVRIESNLIAGGRSAIQVTEGKNIDIADNAITVADLGTTVSSGINDKFSDGSDSTWQGNIITCLDASKTSRGYLLEGSHGHTATGGQIQGCATGILLKDGSTLNKVHANHVTGNDVGILAESFSNSNVVWNNRFANAVNAREKDSQNTWYQAPSAGLNIVSTGTIAGNAWSDYQGFDTNLDRIGDTSLPYKNGISGGDFYPVLTPYAAPTLQILATPSGGGQPLDVQFKAVVETNTWVSDWAWNFGDNSTSSKRNDVVHTYWERGAFNAKLKIKDVAGTEVESQITIHVGQGVKPKVTVQASPIRGNVPLSVTFTASVQDDGATTIAWSFGDGGTATGSSAHHTFTEPGAYTVIATATDKGGLYESASTTVVAGQLPPTVDVTDERLNDKLPLLYHVTAQVNDFSGRGAQAWVNTTDRGQSVTRGDGEFLKLVAEPSAIERTVEVTAVDGNKQKATATYAVQQLNPPTSVQGIQLEARVDSAIGQVPVTANLLPLLKAPHGATLHVDWGDGVVDKDVGSGRTPAVSTISSAPALDQTQMHLEWPPERAAGPLLGPVGTFRDELATVFSKDPTSGDWKWKYQSAWKAPQRNGNWGPQQDGAEGFVWTSHDGRIYVVERYNSDQSTQSGVNYELITLDAASLARIGTPVWIRGTIPMESTMVPLETPQGLRFLFIGGVEYADNQGFTTRDTGFTTTLNPATGDISKTSERLSVGPAPKACWNSAGSLTLLYAETYDSGFHPLPRATKQTLTFTTTSSGWVQVTGHATQDLTHAGPSMACLLDYESDIILNGNEKNLVSAGLPDASGNILYYNVKDVPTQETLNWGTAGQPAYEAAPNLMNSPLMAMAPFALNGVPRSILVASFEDCTAVSAELKDVCASTQFRAQGMFVTNKPRGVQHTYTEQGNHQVQVYAVGHRLTGTTYGAVDRRDGAVAAATVTVPVLSDNPNGLYITPSPDRGQAPLKVKFYPQFVNANPDSAEYDWTLSDGSHFTGRFLEETYSQPGTYVVQLVAKTPDGYRNRAFATIEALTYSADRAAYIVASVDGNHAPTTISATITLRNAQPSDIRSVTWTVDGQTTVGNRLSYEAINGGPHTIEASVLFRDSNTPATAQTTVFVPYSPSSQKVSIVATPTGGRAPVDVRFEAKITTYDGYSPNDFQYAWDFGDGSYSTAREPTHTFRRSGPTHVTLSITDPNGLVTATGLNVNFEAGRYITNVPASDEQCTTPCELQPRIDWSQLPAGRSWLCAWNFDDGAEALDCDTKHQFTAGGRYTLRVSISDAATGKLYVQDLEPLLIYQTPGGAHGTPGLSALTLALALIAAVMVRRRTE